METSTRFRELLRRYRLRTGLTQEALAEQARLSLRGVSDLERGLRTNPYPDTIHRLADALQLTQTERTTLLWAGGRGVGGAPAFTTQRQLPHWASSFLGRQREIADIASCLATNRIVTLTGSGGVGKTRLAVEVAAIVASNYRDSAVFVDLGSLVDTELVAPAFATVLGLREPARIAGD